MPEQSFSKRRRLRKNWEFQKVYAQGQKKSGKFLSVHWLKVSPQEETRVGLCVGRKVGNAVARNRVKRTLREAIRTYPQAFSPGHWLVIAAKKEMVEAEMKSAKKYIYLCLQEIFGS